jgi:hypothetical protein
VQTGLTWFFRRFWVHEAVSLLATLILVVPSVCAPLAVVLGPPMVAGILLFALRTVRGEKPKFGDIFSGFSHMGPCILIGLSYVGLLFASALLLFIPAPLLFWSMAPAYLEIVENGETRVRTALRRSLRTALAAPVRLSMLVILAFVFWLLVILALLLVPSLFFALGGSFKIEALTALGGVTLAASYLLWAGAYLTVPLIMTSALDAARAEAKRIFASRMDEKLSLDDLKIAFRQISGRSEGSAEKVAAKTEAGIPSEAPPAGKSPPRTDFTRVACRCGQVLKVSERLVGKRARCPKCNTVFVVPNKSRPEDPPGQ